MEKNFRKYRSVKISFYNLMFLFEYFVILKGKGQRLKEGIVLLSRFLLDFFQESWLRLIQYFSFFFIAPIELFNLLFWPRLWDRLIGSNDYPHHLLTFLSNNFEVNGFELKKTTNKFHLPLFLFSTVYFHFSSLFFHRAMKLYKTFVETNNYSTSLLVRISSFYITEIP